MHLMRDLAKWVKGQSQVHRRQRQPNTKPEPLKLLDFSRAGSVAVAGRDRDVHIAVKEISGGRDKSGREKSAGVEKPELRQFAEVSYRQTGREDGCDQFVVEIYPDPEILKSGHPALEGLRKSSSQQLTLADWVSTKEPGKTAEACVSTKEPDKTAEACVSTKEPGKTAEAWVVKELLGIVKDLSDRNLVVTNMRPESFIFVNGRFMLAASSHVVDCRQPLPSELEVVPEYAAPELIELAGHELTPQANLFSLGAIIYFMVCGFQLFQLPQIFDGNSIRRAALEEQKSRLGRDDLFYKNLRKIAQCDKQVKNFIGGLLKLDPNERLSLQEAVCHEWLQITAQDPSSHAALKCEQKSRPFRRSHQL